MAQVRVERHEGVEVWTLDREPARNALSRQLVQELAEATSRIGTDREVRVVVITGAGGQAFCAGADLKERSSMSEGEVRAFLELLGGTLRGIERSERVFVAAINGAALGGGAELALACDLRVAAPEAALGLPEVSLGIIPGAGGTVRLARLIGPGRAKDLIFGARRIGADEALAMGLVDRVARDRPVLEEALTLAKGLAAQAPLALAAAKRAIDGALELPMDEALALERREYERVLGTKDRLEGLAAFRERRPPRYRGE